MCRVSHPDWLRRTLRRALALAREARAERVGSHHLLFALLQEPRTDVPLLIAAFGVTPEQLRERLATACEPTPGEWPYTTHACRALAALEREAVRTGHDSPGPEHLLLGLLETAGEAGEVLRGLGVRASAVRSAVYAQTELEGRGAILETTCPEGVSLLRCSALPR